MLSQSDSMKTTLQGGKHCKRTCVHTACQSPKAQVALKFHSKAASTSNAGCSYLVGVFFAKIVCHINLNASWLVQAPEHKRAPGRPRHSRSTGKRLGMNGGDLCGNVQKLLQKIPKTFHSVATPTAERCSSPTPGPDARGAMS